MELGGYTKFFSIRIGFGCLWQNTPTHSGSKKIRTVSLFLKELVLAAEGRGGRSTVTVTGTSLLLASCSTIPVHGLLQSHGNPMVKVSVGVGDITSIFQRAEKGKRMKGRPLPSLLLLLSSLSGSSPWPHLHTFHLAHPWRGLRGPRLAAERLANVVLSDGHK